MSHDPKLGYGLAGCGCLLAALTGAVGLFGAYHVFLDPRGKISADEAAPAMGAFCCTFVGVAMFALGLVLALRKPPAAPGDAPPAPPPAGG